MPDPEPVDLDSWMSQPSSNRPVKCWICRDEKLASSVRRFYLAREVNESTSRSWAEFHKQVLVDGLGWEGSSAAMLQHVRHHLRGKVTS